MRDLMGSDAVIQRVQKMEALFDTISTAVREYPDRMWEDDVFCNRLQELIQYYESGEWLKDFERDERGELPAELKRGVLAEDAVYDLLCELEQLRPQAAEDERS